MFLQLEMRNVLYNLHNHSKKPEYSKSSAYEWITDKKLCIDIIQQTVWTYTSEKLVCLENLQTQNGAKKLFIMNYLHSICLTFSC